MSTATMTELLRTPKEVVAQTNDGPVRITRRDAADLILLNAGDLEDNQRGITLALRIAREALRQGGDMRSALCELYPWMSLFSEAAGDEFAREMDRLVWASGDLGHFGALLTAFAGWEATAAALADGWHADDDLEWITDEDTQDVERPL
jgi:PHD/YefM family antitoxin component YafN of YafNO toxin-antitoxin module